MRCSCPRLASACRAGATPVAAARRRRPPPGRVSGPDVRCPPADRDPASSSGSRIARVSSGSGAQDLPGGEARARSPPTSRAATTAARSSRRTAADWSTSACPGGARKLLPGRRRRSTSSTPTAGATASSCRRPATTASIAPRSGGARTSWSTSTAERDAAAAALDRSDHRAHRVARRDRDRASRRRLARRSRRPGRRPGTRRPSPTSPPAKACDSGRRSAAASRPSRNDGRFAVWSAGAGGPIDALDLATRRSWTVLEKGDPHLPRGARLHLLSHALERRLAARRGGLRPASTTTSAPTTTSSFSSSIRRRSCPPPAGARARAVAPHPGVDRFPDLYRPARPVDPPARRSATAPRRPHRGRRAASPAAQ